MLRLRLYFFFQAEDGIRDKLVTGVQTCALPIWAFAAFPLMDACDRYGVALIEDAAEALGASYRGRPAGSFGLAGILSFNGNKIITTGGGGMLVTDDGRIAAQTRHLSTQARENEEHYEHRKVGYNYRLSNLLAAVGRGQLQRLGATIASRP